MQKKRSGFSLIELMVAVTILAVATSIGVVSYTNANRKARNGKRQADLEQVRAALELYRTDYGKYPSRDSWTSMVNDLMVDNYINQEIHDPKQVPGDVDTDYSYSVTGGTMTQGRAYEVCATLEPEVVGTYDYCLTSP